MYLAHFGFTHYPFERALQPDELFASSAAREAQARLNHLIELRGIGLITGEVGSGKTTRVPATVRRACIRASTACSTCRCPPATCSTCTRPSPGSWACPSSATAPAPTAPSTPRSRA